MSSEIITLTATEAVRRLHDGRLDRLDLIEAYLDHIAACEPGVRAFEYFDPVQVRAAMASVRPGPLQGIPVGVKDVLDTADMPSQYGSPIWKGWRPKANSAPVAWARAAGAVVLGKTVTTEFATRRPGPTMNPVNPAHTPRRIVLRVRRGSRCRPVSASLRHPDRRQRDPSGRLLRRCRLQADLRHDQPHRHEDHVRQPRHHRHHGPHRRRLRAVRRRRLRPRPRRSGRRARPSPRIGICQSPTWDVAAPETHALLARVTEALGRAGASIIPRELPLQFNALIDAHPVIMNSESGRALGWELANHPDQISDGLRERLGWGLGQPQSALENAYAVFASCQRAFPDAIDGLDVLVTPSAPGEAPNGLEWTGDPAFNFIWTSLHVPCVTVPAGTGPNGLPLGIQIVGRQGDDRAVLAWARWVEAAIG